MASNVKPFHRKVQCDLCTPAHMVDVRGIKQHQQRVRTEQQALSVGIPVVHKNRQVDIEEWKNGFERGWAAARADERKTA